MPRLEDQVLYSRSARDLIRIHEQNPELFERLSRRRPVLRCTSPFRSLTYGSCRPGMEP
jgi:hypothetical protein